MAFDERPTPELNSEAIDCRAASESFASLRTLSRKDLEPLRLITPYQRRKVPTTGGTPLIGHPLGVVPVVQGVGAAFVAILYSIGERKQS